jgi:hypothetical protein
VLGVIWNGNVGYRWRWHTDILRPQARSVAVGGMLTMVDTVKRGTVRYYLTRRKEIIDMLARGGHEPDYVKMLEDARDMAQERIQQLTNIAAMRDVIAASSEDRALDRVLRDVIGRQT